MALRRPKGAPRHNALVAAAVKVNLADTKMAERQAAKRQEWHPEAFAYFDEVPEIKESVRYRGNQLAKVRLYIAVDNPDDPEGDPVPVTDEASGVPDAIAQAAVSELARLRSIVGGQGEIMRMLDMNLELAGECYLVGFGATTEQVKQRDGTTKAIERPEDWSIKSVSQVSVRNGVYSVKSSPSDNKPKVLDDQRDTIIRIWTRHPQWSEMPDSAMRGLLGECRALQVLTQQVLAHANRSLSAGFFTMPSELSFGPLDPTKVDADADADTGDGGDSLDDVMHAVLVEPIEDPTATASVQPGLLRGPAEYLQPEYVRRITFYDAELVAGIEARIDARVARIARGLNLPVEKVMGLAQTTFANAAQVDEDEYNDFLAPSVATATDALTWAFLWPQLEEHPDVPAEWVNRLFVLGDPSGLIAEPDTQANADAAWDRGTISDATYRQAKGFNDSDSPEADELLIRAGLRRGIMTGPLTVALLNMLAAKAGLEPIELPEAADEEMGDPDAVARMVQQLSASPGALDSFAAALAEHLPPQPALPVGREPPPFAGPEATANAPGSPDYGRQLTDLDRELRSRLVVASNDAMGRALERAANRLRSKANGTEIRSALRQVPLRSSFAHLGPSLVAQVLAEDDPLAGAWDELHGQFSAWGTVTQASALAILVQLAGGRVDSSTAAGLAARQADDLTQAWEWFATALDTLANERLYDPDPASPELGEHDPTLRVPAGMVRQASARAGGATGLSTELVGWVVLSDGGTRPAGGIGTGELIRGGMRDAGVSIEAYRWVYGPAQRPQSFLPHLVLDGQTFRNFDDEVLANPEPWPPRPFLMPGDHAGCVCDAEPIILPPPPLA